MTPESEKGGACWAPPFASRRLEVGVQLLRDEGGILQREDRIGWRDTPIPAIHQGATSLAISMHMSRYWPRLLPGSSLIGHTPIQHLVQSYRAGDLAKRRGFAGHPDAGRVRGERLLMEFAIHDFVIDRLLRGCRARTDSSEKHPNSEENAFHDRSTHFLVRPMEREQPDLRLEVDGLDVVVNQFSSTFRGRGRWRAGPLYAAVRGFAMVRRFNNTQPIIDIMHYSKKIECRSVLPIQTNSLARGNKGSAAYARELVTELPATRRTVWTTSL